MKHYIIFTGNNTFQKVQAEDYNDAYSKVSGYLGAVSNQWKILYGKYYKLHNQLKKYDEQYIVEHLGCEGAIINGEMVLLEDILKLDYIYINQDGDSEFVLPIQFLTDEQMYILVAYMERIIKLL